MQWLEDKIKKLIVPFVLGLIIGYLLCSKGMYFISSPQGISIAPTPTPLAQSMDITGEWVYEVEPIEKNELEENKKISSDEDNCYPKRSGEVTISYGENYQLSLQGKRKQKCAEEGKYSNNVSWASEAAALIVADKRVLAWILTRNEVTKYGRILVTISKNEEGKPPNKMIGDLFYLDERDHTWIKASIILHKKGSMEANIIEQTWK
jgi:hypothetical protein